jgi:hypothetical protein
MRPSGCGSHVLGTAARWACRRPSTVVKSPPANNVCPARARLKTQPFAETDGSRGRPVGPVVPSIAASAERTVDRGPPAP